MKMDSRSGVQASAVDYDPFAGEALVRVVPTTEPQREVWLADRLGREASLAYNESVSLRFGGALDVAALQGALADLAERHESLRATLSADGESLEIAATATLAATVEDLAAVPPSAREAALASARLRAVDTPLDLERGPLVRAVLLRLAPQDHVLVLTLHHAVCDGWSFGVLARDLAALYARRTGAAAELPPAPQYGDYALAERAFAGSDAHRADEQYWLSRFAGPAPVLDLPTDRPRGAWRTFASRREDHALDAVLVADLRKLAGRRGIGLYGTMLGAFAGLLHRVSGARDVVVGMPAAGQTLEGFENLVGHCVNLLPLRVACDPAAPAAALLAGAQSAVLDAYEHQRYTFGTLLSKLALPRDPRRLPLVSVLFNVDQKLEGDALGFPGLAVDFRSNPRVFENFELFVNAVPSAGGLVLECQYNSDLFDPETVRRWLANYETLLRSLVADADRPLGELDAISPAERELLARWNTTERAYDLDQRLGDLVARGLAAHREREAVAFEGRRVTGAELDDMAWAIAHRLRALGVAPGTLVGVCLERSVELVASLAGVAYSGGAYVPLDPSYPAERLARMCEDAALGIVITRREEHARVASALPAGVHVVRLDEETLVPPPAASRTLVGAPDDPAYVIFTSGSTGRPKGAMNAHRGIVNRLLWMQEAYDIVPGDRVMQKTPYSFDVSVWEFFWPLMTGATIVVARPEGHRDPAYLADLIRAEGVTLLHFVPSMLRTFLEHDGVEACTGLKRVVCSGEGLPIDAVEAFFAKFPATHLDNLYGPTEAAVDVTAWPCRPREPAGIVPIGLPIANTQIHVLDESRRPVPIGSAGELYIGGVQVGMGYVARPELTAERFVDDPFRPGGRLYRTGDLARWRGDGRIEHLGRLDFQVKVRGFRIELGEIETGLSTVEGLAQSVVVAREDRPGDVRLVGYVVPRAGATLAEETLQAHLKRTLPDYMVPQHFVSLAEMPLLPNGKVDRKALPAPQAIPSGREFVAPRDELEAAVAREMEAALGLPGIGVHDDFFRLGGHSLLAAQLTARLNRALKTHLTMRTLFAAPTVARLAEAVREETASTRTPRRKPLARLATPGEAPMSAMQERLWFLEELNPGRVTYNAPSAHRLTGPLDEAAFARAFAEMIRRQPVLRTSFEPRGASAVQRIHDTIAFSLFPAEDLSALPAAAREARLAARLDELTAQTFDLKRVPLFKAHLFRLGLEEHVLFFMPHHIIWDGWSFDILYDELSALYGAFARGLPAPLPELRFTYGDFAAWHRDWSAGPEFAEQLAFWRARLDRIESARALPTDRPRRPGMTGAGDTEWMVVDKPLADALHAIGRKAGATLFLTTLAAYCAMLHGYAGQDRLVVGTPVRGRNAEELEPIMGFFNNLVPLAIDVDPAQSFLVLLERVKAVAVESFASPDVPLEQLAGELAVRRGAGGGSLLYQALFSFQDARQRITRWGDLAHAVVPLFQKGATEDLGLWFVESAGGLHGGVTYNTDILDRATAQELHRAYLALLAGIAADPARSVADLLGPKGAAVRAKATAEPLPMPAARVSPDLAPAGTPPATETEKRLAGIWREQLKLPQVSLEDNFFDLGGHSLLAMQAILAMETSTGKRIDRNRYIFESLAQIAQAYDEAPGEAPAKSGGLRRLFSSLVGGRKD